MDDIPRRGSRPLPPAADPSPGGDPGTGAAASGRSPRARRTGRLAAGRHGLTREQVVASQRARLLRAMTEAVGELGYEATSVDTVIRSAGVSRRTFYAIFASKDDCFAMAHEAALDRLVSVAAAALGSQRSWADGLRGAVTALLSSLAGDEPTARLCFAEALTAGPHAVERREQALARLAVLFDAPEVRASPVAETLVRGRLSELSDLLRREVTAGRAAALPQLAPVVMYAMTVPFLGREAAAAELRAHRARPTA
jgi:AcrR family transcriptional regulator